jgi:hypothetical protein
MNWNGSRLRDADCIRIRQIPGIGPVVATAIIAAIGNGAAFRKGREFAAAPAASFLPTIRPQRLSGLLDIADDLGNELKLIVELADLCDTKAAPFSAHPPNREKVKG